jgi:mono/diheme cytochrome c family protein
MADPKSNTTRIQRIPRRRRATLARDYGLLGDSGPPWLLVAVAALLGCHSDMYEQPRYEPLEASDFFEDGRSARPLVPGTIRYGDPPGEDVLHTGRNADGQLAQELPQPLTKGLLERGQERFEIYCAVCHSRSGDGNGMIVQRGYRQPPTYHSDRLRGAPIGHFFDVMTNGFGAMPSYADQVPVDDRWAIAAYIRALQLSQFATIDDVPPNSRQRLEQELKSSSPTETP